MISEWDREGDLENRRNNETILPFPVCNGILSFLENPHPCEERAK